MAVLSVRELNHYVRRLLEQDRALQEVAVIGEVANFRAHPSGHLYFTLKDEEASIRAVMFRSRRERLRWLPENGQSVLAIGRVSLYERDGTYQLYVDSLEPVGVGSQYLALLERKARLEAEGLFRADRKRRLPVFPRWIGVVTARQGAALRDIVTVARRRNPGINILVAPALVQGAEAPASIVAALNALYARPELDVIIVGRGGGGKEDLSAFDDEAVVRAVAASPVPIVSAVGHEIDVTLVDFAADVRAPTPSAAAELVVPQRSEWVMELAVCRERLQKAMAGRLERLRLQVRLLASRRVLERPEDLLADARQRLDRARIGLAQTMRSSLNGLRLSLAHQAAKLDALSPLAVLARGYAVLHAEGRIVKSVRNLALGQEFTGRLSDGSFTGRVTHLAEG